MASCPSSNEVIDYLSASIGAGQSMRCVSCVFTILMSEESLWIVRPVTLQVSFVSMS